MGRERAEGFVVSAPLEIGTRVEVDLKKSFGIEGFGRGRIEFTRNEAMLSSTPPQYIYLVWFDKFVMIRDETTRLMELVDTRLTPVGENRAEHWLRPDCMRKLNILELVAEAAQ